MPNTSAAKKALRQNITRKVRNLRNKRVLLSVMKDYKKAIEEGQTEEAAAKLPMVYKRLDKAAKTNLIKPNKANRLKSRLTKKLKGVSSTPTVAPIKQEDQTPTPEL